MKIHIVQKGDTLWKIAKKYGVNFEELKKMNSQLSNPDMIMPGMKVKVPTTGGTIKKEAPMGSKPNATINLGAKKEMPLAEHPFAKEKPITMPMVEAPKKEAPIVKEAPIIKEAPKAPYTPKMPLQVVPEIDINNYYMMNMQNMSVQPKPTNILPEVKEAPKKEMPVKEMPLKQMPAKEMPANPVPSNPVPAPVQEAPVEMPQDYCVPVTPVMPGPGFCPPMGGYPMQQPYMPYQPMQGAPMMPNAGVAPSVAGAPYMPHFEEESSSFMPQMPMMNPAYNPGAVMGAQNPGFQQQMPAPYMNPAGYGQGPAGYEQMPAGYGQGPAGYEQMPAGYGQAPAGYEQMPAGYGQGPAGYEQMPAGYGQMPAGYGQAPAGYGQMPAGYGQAPAGYGQMPMGYPAGNPMESSPGFQGPQNPAEFAQPGGVMPGTMYGNPAMGTPYGMGAAPYGAGGPYGQIPYGYPPMAGGMQPAMGETDFESPEGTPVGPQMPFMQNPTMQGFPVGTGALGDCGCDPMPTNVPQSFVPPTPPIYSAPYSGPVNVAQPPYMNPYGMGPVGTSPYGMPGYYDESN